MNRFAANAAGITAMVFWSMNVGVTRRIAEGHIYGMPGLSFTAAGLALILFDILRGKEPPWRSRADAKFWPLAGGAFVAYVILYVIALAWADSRPVALSLGLINYFWPALILLLMPFFSKIRVRKSVLAAGLALCLTGLSCAFLWGVDFAEAVAGFSANWPGFPMMGAAAFLWAFYSNAARKWAADASAVGWFELAAGLTFLVLWLFRGGDLGFSREMVIPFLAHALLINAVSYLFWDWGVRWGDIGWMGALANFLPLGSVIFGNWLFGGGATPGLWLGCLMVTAGAMLSRRALCKDPNGQTSPNPDGES